ncbi:MAG: hypothetical protein H0X24_17910 [Ktedonobacterales bacterium]|nr:hypothetical protein [Ktedonobacterales bacterium]
MQSAKSSLPQIIGYLFLSLTIFVGWRIEARYDATRQAIARGEAIKYPLASLQPQAVQEAMSLPFTFRIKMPWRSFWASLGIVLLVISCLLSITSYFIDSKTDLPTLLLVTIFIIGFMDVFFILLFLGMAISLQQKVVITADDITLYQGSRKHRVRWDEARIFILPKSAQKLPKSLRKFELASRDGIVTWSYFPTKQSWFFCLLPTIPPNDYNHIIDALNAYVIARTGLTLYDLRG